MFGGTAANVRSLFPWMEVSKAVQKPNGGSGSASQRRQQARTPQSFCLCQMSVNFPVHSRICPRMDIAVYMRVCYTHCT